MKNCISLFRILFLILVVYKVSQLDLLSVYLLIIAFIQLLNNDKKS